MGLMMTLRRWLDFPIRQACRTAEFGLRRMERQKFGPITWAKFSEPRMEVTRFGVVRFVTVCGYMAVGGKKVPIIARVTSAYSAVHDCWYPMNLVLTVNRFTSSHGFSEVEAWKLSYWTMRTPAMQSLVPVGPDLNPQ